MYINITQYYLLLVLTNIRSSRVREVREEGDDHGGHHLGALLPEDNNKYNYIYIYI